ncbi:MAG: hypothetical protein ABIG68_05035 [Acidobacteriota bacterium]
MKTLRCLAAVMICASAPSGIGSQELDEKTTIRETWTFPAGSRSVEIRVDNIEGSIAVSGYGGDTVEMTAEKLIHARSAEALQRARDEVTLDIVRRSDLFDAYVNTPWRREEGRRRKGRPADPGYRVRFDFVLQVPAGAKIFLRTINDGDIRVQNISGDYDIKNINGGIEMLEVSGSGDAYALNGKLRGLFRGNPVRASYFGTLNGDIDLFFQPGLSADLRLKTFNGEVYTDFEITGLPPEPMQKTEHEGRSVYKAPEYFGVRVAAGGPEMRLETFNGDIRVHCREP